MTVRDVYERVCEALLEPNGLELGLVTEADFLSYFSDVITDWTQRTALIKKIISIPLTSGTSIYDEPGSITNVQEALLAFRYLHNVTVYDADRLTYFWQQQSGAPVSWYEDRLGVEKIGLMPTPNVTGYTIGASGTGLYGTIAGYTSGNDFTINASTDFYGVISSFSGPIYLETMGYGYGTIEQLYTSSANLNLIAAVKPIKNDYTLDDDIEFVPDAFVHYLTYGVLEHVFNSDSENKDMLRARYCKARWDEGVNLARAISEEAMEEEGEEV